jgi:phage-related protein
MALEYGSQLGMMAIATRGMGFASIFTGNAMKAFWAAAFGPIGLVVAAVALLAGVIIYNWDTIKGWTTAAWNFIVGIISGAWNWISTKVDQSVAFIRGVFNWFSELGSLLNSWVGHAKDIVIFRFHQMVDWVKGLPGRILGALGNLGGMLYDAGAALVRGFLNGIKARWDDIVAFVKGGMTKLRNLWPFSPAKTGPFSGRGYVTYSGRALTGDFAASIRRGIPGIIAAARSAVGAARERFGASATVGRSAVAPRAVQAPSTVTVVVDSAGSRMDDMMVEFLNRALRERGLDGVA